MKTNWVIDHPAKKGRSEEVNAATFWTTVFVRLVFLVGAVYLFSRVLPGTFWQWWDVVCGLLLLNLARTAVVRFADKPKKRGII